MTPLEFGFCTGGMLFPRRAIGPGDRTLCEDELRWVKRRPRSIEQAVFACSTRTDNEKKLPAAMLWRYSSSPMSTAGAACVILLVEM